MVQKLKISRILVANRGEIVLRVFRTAKRMGITTVAVYSEPDHSAPHVLAADIAEAIGAGPAAESYLNIERIIAAALKHKCDAIHPGYGFLSENADFAAAVCKAGLKFIGPSAETIATMGNKPVAKDMAAQHGVPVLPGYNGADQSRAVLVKHARDIGLPVMFKASAGGGGRGLRLVEHPADLDEALDLARAEAISAFGDAHLIIEKAVASARHIEIQVFGDENGNIIHLGERDCSAQRRHQKVLEETPCPVLADQQRDAICQAAVSVAQSVSYVGAGTVEFILAPDLAPDGKFYFLEMNTRLQVEHTVTEAVTGLDLVEWQILVAEGADLPLQQDQIKTRGHAIQARLCAEDPASGFLPQTGIVTLWSSPEISGVRVDAAICEGQEITAYYDSLLGKIIAVAEDRPAAIRLLNTALTRTKVAGVTTNRAFLIDLLTSQEFTRHEVSTDYIDKNYSGGFAVVSHQTEIAATFALLAALRQRTLFAKSLMQEAGLLGWSSGPAIASHFRLAIGGVQHIAKIRFEGFGALNIDIAGNLFQATVQISGDASAAITIGGENLPVGFVQSEDLLEVVFPNRSLSAYRVSTRSSATQVVGNSVKAPMPGIIRNVKASASKEVVKGETLVVLEAMKMQHQICASRDGSVSAVLVTVGQQVSAGEIFVEMEAPDATGS
jgi:geranyl-CoA carboxylase alpha subunit